MMLTLIVLCFQVVAILMLLYSNNSITNKIDDLVRINVKLVGLINNVHNDLIASSQEITKEITDSCNMLMVAKKKALETEKHTEELYNNALEAMRSYAGKTGRRSGCNHCFLETDYMQPYNTEESDDECE